MKLIITEADGIYSENTMLGCLAGAGDLSDLVANIIECERYRNCSLYFENYQAQRFIFNIIQNGLVSDTDLDKFKENTANKISIMTEDFELTVESNEFERQCSITVQPFKY